MNKVAIKNFAVEARKKLIASVKDKAGRIGIIKENITEAISKGQGYAVFPTHIGIETTLVGKELKQRENLVNRIKEKGYESVIEEVAYTWFNRIIAVRFMEVNDYLPSRIRVLSSETKGKFEPDIVTQAPNIDLELTQQETEEIISLKEKNDLDKLFRLLFIKQCNEFGEILPELFESTSKDNKDYTEMLLDISYTNEDGVIRDLLMIDEEYFLEAVEIIGWMYQYYNTEPKDETFALLKQNVKITKERIPAATQLFTPDWIVRYMVENSLGRLWLEGHPNDTLKADWKYFLDEAEQEPDVITQQEKIRVEYKTVNPEEIKVIDPCMGSGHILGYAFEVLMQIYESCGYTQRDAANLIVEKNLYGLDIDDRAHQLAYFAVMMKGRKYDKRFLAKGISPNLCSIQESNGLISFEQGAGQLKLDSIYKEKANYLITAFRDAKEYGSILSIEHSDYDGLLGYILKLQEYGAEDLFMSMWLSNISTIMPALIRQAKIMAQKYDVVVTNPPYMSNGGMGANLSGYVKTKHPDTKADLFAIFIEKGFEMAKPDGFNCMITMQSWMFLSSFEKFRRRVIREKDIINLVQIGYNSFPELNSKVAQATAFVLRNKNINNYMATYLNLNNNYQQSFNKEDAFFLEIYNKAQYKTQKESFSKIPGAPIAYWVSESIRKIFKNGIPLRNLAKPVEGIKTGDNDKFLRLWHEINYSFIKASFKKGIEQDKDINEKWFPICKGGEFRKWYGNNQYVINWINDGREIQEFKGATTPNRDLFFRKALTWGYITSGSFSMRYMGENYLFNNMGPGCYIDDENLLLYLLALTNSVVINTILKILAPTIAYKPGDIGNIPVCLDDSVITSVVTISKTNVNLSRNDWDKFETSWDFKRHPFLNYYILKEDISMRLKAVYNIWKTEAEEAFIQLKANEENLNRIFIEIYELQNELTPGVEEKNITIRRADLERDVKSFISYAVGCIFGRYSLDIDGLAYAGGKWHDSRYLTFIPKYDNIIPITDEEYFDDDIVARFVDFVRVVYSEDTLDENLEFIAEALGNKGSTSREIIRNYFLKDFYKDHVKTYQKRPIYWLFDSGKENGFKALIYLHRYNEDTVGRVRADYLHKTQAAIENAIAHCDVVLESNASASDKAKAVKKKEKLVKQLAETRIYDQAIAHIAHQRISLDLDDGVVANYAKFQDVVVSSEGKKAVKVNLLGRI